MSIFAKTNEFQTHILKIPPPPHPVKALDARWCRKTPLTIAEELGELELAIDAHDRGECVDALIDIIYFASGALNQLGVCGDAAFDLVHEANMQKVKGVKDARGLHDAIKPREWVSPDHSVWFDQ